MFPLCATIFFHVTELKSGDDTWAIFIRLGLNTLLLESKPLSLDLLYQISITKLLYALWLQYLFSTI